MKTRVLLLPFVLILSFSLSSFGQDQIHKKNNEVINCKIKEIGMDEIKYTVPDYPQDVLFTIDKDKVLKIVFENGQELFFQQEMTNPENYVDNKKNAIKIDFLSPLTGNTTFAYEHSLKPGRSIEATLGIIGLGADPNDYDPAGVFIKFGPKFIKSPDFYLRGMKYAHILKGGYIKPEFSIGYYSRYFYEYNYYYDEEKVRDNVVNATIMLNIGKQWIFDNSFLVDFYFGVGYGFDSNDWATEYHYSHITADEDVPLSFGAGLKIGWLFK
ncbi:MAG: hypothetical protein JW731_03030 [Bacteroidales bacterium]|nr:hypothetical protein [Bacteroidales bacterium]